MFLCMSTTTFLFYLKVLKVADTTDTSLFLIHFKRKKCPLLLKTTDTVADTYSIGEVGVSVLSFSSSLVNLSPSL